MEAVLGARDATSHRGEGFADGDAIVGFAEEAWGAEAWVSEPRLREEVSAGCAGKVPDELCLRCEQCAEEIARIGRPGAQRLAHTLIATHAWPATTPQSTCTTSHGVRDRTLSVRDSILPIDR